jgi:hypothetical protein
MMKWPLLSLALLLAACDPAAPPQPETGPKPDAAFAAQIEAAEKARAVEAQVMDAAEAQRKQIDEAAQ